MLTSLSFNTISRNVEGLGLSPFVVFSLFAVVVPLSVHNPICSQKL